MKKFLSIAVLCAMLVTMLLFAGCSGGDTENADAQGNSMSLEEIAAEIKVEDPDFPATGEMALDAESYPYFLFIDYVEGSEAYLSEALINAVAHSVVLLRVPEDADAQAIADSIEENANPAKWVCVSAEKTSVVRHGNTIMLVMSSEEAADEIVGKFNALFE